MITLRAWYLAEALADVWGDPCTYREDLAARNDELFAQRRDEETHELVVIDQEGVDRWLDTAARDYDVSTEVGA